jgi:hypothetical protein
LSKWLWGIRFDSLVILGDLTEEKDCHSSVLVNRLVAALTEFVREGISVHLLMGNHDYAEASSPFFRFLAHHPRCYYYAKPQIVEIGNCRWAFFPHMRDPIFGDPQRLRSVRVDFVGCHQKFRGATSESGHSLSGCSTSDLEKCGKVWAGDIHVPQKVGPVEYVGAPYPIRFGDAFKPRVVLIDGKQHKDLYPISPQKLVLRISDPDELEYQPLWQPGDQVKVELSLRRSEFDCWEKYQRKIRRMCERNDLLLCGVSLVEAGKKRLRLDGPTAKIGTPREQFEAYCEQAGIDDADAAVGRELL